VEVLFSYVDYLSALELAENHLVGCFLFTSVQNQETVQETDKVYVLLARVVLVNLRVAPLDSLLGLYRVDDLIDFMGSHR
jgi:hypothetical protein